MDDSSYVEMGQRESSSDDRRSSNSDNNNRPADGSSLLLFLPTRGFFRQTRAFREMAAPYFAEQAVARGLFASMIALTLLNSAVRVVFSYLARDFWTALSAMDPDAFYRIMQRFFAALVLLAPITVFYRYQRQKLAIHWRGWMTERVLELYASNSSVYYGLERSGGGGRVEQDDSEEEKAALSSSSQPSSFQATKRQKITSKSTAPVGVDNPDQRIAEDVRSFTEFSLSLFLTILTASMDLCCFSIVLFTILPRLFLAIILLAATGTLFTILIGRVLIQLNYDKLLLEANLRFSLVRVREYAEQIAFLAGEDVEKRQIQYRLAQVIRNMHDINIATRNLDFFTTYYAYLTWILPILVIAPSYFAGEVDLGVIQQAAASFSHVLDDLSILVTQWDSLSEFSAGIDRLYTFLKAMQALDPSRNTYHGNQKDTIMGLPDYQASKESKSLLPVSPVSTMINLQRYVDSDKSSLALIIRNLTLTTPASQQERILFQNLNVEVEWRKNLLIQGASGIGKSSLLRAVAGLWKAGSGLIQRPRDEDVYFLPQKPYCCVGTLRDQLLYPRISGYVGDNEVDSDNAGVADHVWRDRNKYNDNALLDILHAVDLEDLPQRAASSVPQCTNGLDAVMDWSNILSLGEQQRLAFGRVLVNQPRFVILDESTSAMDVESEIRMYELLTSTGVTYVSVGHRRTLLAHHDTKLVLRRDGLCEVEPIVR
eukprot:scaffold38301_cov191-Amphora_coffeaeformis.AAC.1